MPREIQPMLATLVNAPFDRTGWLFEIKWDGYRIIARVAGGRVTLQSRHGKDYTDRYAPVVKALSRMKHNAVIDGEMIAIDKTGTGTFQALQNYMRGKKGALVYVAFDLLSLDGEDLRALPLTERKRRLKRILPKSSALMFSAHVERRGVSFFEAAKKKRLEGIMAKNAASPYREGFRGNEWLKIKARPQQEVVVGGFTEPLRGRKHFGALVVGVQDEGGLRYVGHVGTGFDDRMLAATYAKLKRLERKTSPFQSKVKTNTPAHWVEPKLVAEVAFAGWTGDGHLRQPAFLGWREDKSAKDVVEERPETRLLKPADRKPKSLTHLEKTYWPKEGYTKGDVIGYYRDIAEVILPHLKDRPMSMRRNPEGIIDEGFFQKDVSTLHLPKWAKTIRVKSESEKRTIEYLLCQDARALEYMANLGCIELNPWNARRPHLAQADYVVMDLDPVGVPFRKVIEAALAVHEVFEELGVPNVCKTSGGRGLHVYAPLAPGHSHEQARKFAELTAALVREKLPGTVSTVRNPDQRRGRVYFDFLQNKLGATNVAVYSLRPRPGAPVSTPLKWSEIREGLDPTDFNITNARKRIDRWGDLFAPILGPGAKLKDVLDRLGK